MKKLILALFAVFAVTAGSASLSACDIFGGKPDGDSGKTEHVHDYTEYVSKATCLEDGYKRYSCKCGDGYREDLPALGHAMEYDVCTRCGFEAEDVAHTRGLKYGKLYANGEVFAYSVSGRGTADGAVITVPATYAGKPVIKIGAGAFRGDTELVELTATENITTIEANAFSGCENLTAVSGLSQINNLGAGAFKNCAKLQHIPAPIEVDTVGKETFSGCSSLQDFRISAREIGESAFKGCSAFSDIVVADGIEKIGALAFENCSKAQSITLGAGLNGVGLNAFIGCSALHTVRFSGDLSGWLNIAFETAENKTRSNPLNRTGGGSELYIGGEKLQNVEAPEGIEKINDIAFANCISIETVSLPASVKTVGASAFAGCVNLTSLTLEGVEEISENAFERTHISDLVLPEGCKSLGERAFAGCPALRNVSLPKSLRRIGDRSFAPVSGASNTINRMDYAGTLTTWCTMAFLGENANPMLYVNGKKLYIDGALVQGEVTVGDAGSNVPVWINDYALQSFSGITKLTATGRMTSIGNYAFSGCVALEEVVLPDTVTELGEYIFKNCTKIDKLTYSASKASWDKITKPKTWKKGGAEFRLYTTGLSYPYSTI